MKPSIEINRGRIPQGKGHKIYLWKAKSFRKPKSCLGIKTKLFKTTVVDTKFELPIINK